MKRALTWFAAAITLAGCGGKMRSVAERPWSPTPQSAAEAREARYQFAFSAQVVDAESLAVITDFAVDTLEPLPPASALLNPMGDSRGLFHISRAYRASDAEVVAFPLLITAPGRDPVIEWVDIRTDCDGGVCPGEKATLIGMRAWAEPVHPAPVSLRAAAETLRTQGADRLLREALANHKLDTEARRIVSGAASAASRAVLVLGGTASASVPGEVATLLGAAPSGAVPSQVGGALLSLLPLLVASSPEAAAAIAATSQLLPYLKPLLDQLKASGKGGRLAELLLALSGAGAKQSWLSSLASLLQQSKPAFGQWAMGSLLPLLQGMASGQPKLGATAQLLAKLLEDPALKSFLSGAGAHPGTAAALQSLLPLLHGLAGGNGSEVATLLNRLLAQWPNRLEGLKGFPGDEQDLDRFGRLLPFLAPLVDGLNGPQGKTLQEWLSPLLSGNNPAGTLRAWATGSLGAGRSAALLAALYPGLSRVLGGALPEKQLLTAQLLSGLLSSDLSDLAIEGDIAGASAVLVRGSARDLLKLAQLPNVVKILGLH